jgi:hypothetical protein
MLPIAENQRLLITSAESVVINQSNQSKSVLSQLCTWVELRLGKSDGNGTRLTPAAAAMVAGWRSRQVNYLTVTLESPRHREDVGGRRWPIGEMFVVRCAIRRVSRL